ncbi:unnamed protein product [[Actinomadura] parvosata subsp. kistnae]|uniref:hypothetical protein n=1 Tax=[Actinomadura] parvosata TaxID=1955412 RepID=UPI000D272FD5|nr:hypothetical protein [Nonomuraea sp. ATCC 55076]SPL93129.1 unnamed protein product [Actinomadura parvosata subsp. kistnae]
MSEQGDWRELRDRRMAEPGAAEAYEATRLAYERGRTARVTRLARDLGRTMRAMGEEGGTSRCTARREPPPDA